MNKFEKEKLKNKELKIKLANEIMNIENQTFFDEIKWKKTKN
jgi:hypothetical protein